MSKLSDDEIDACMSDDSLDLRARVCAQAKLANKSAAGGAEAVAYLKEWVSHGDKMRRVDLKKENETWLAMCHPTVTPLYAHSSVAGMPDEPTYWLIEYIPHKYEENKTPRWWNGTNWNFYKDGSWTEDSNNAIKFANDIEANVVLMALNNFKRAHHQDLGWHRSSFGEIKVTEHKWPTVRALGGA